MDAWRGWQVRDVPRGARMLPLLLQGSTMAEVKRDGHAAVPSRTRGQQAAHLRLPGFALGAAPLVGAVRLL